MLVINLFELVRDTYLGTSALKNTSDVFLYLRTWELKYVYNLIFYFNFLLIIKLFPIACPTLNLIFIFICSHIILFD